MARDKELDDAALAQTFSYNLAGIERVLRQVDAEERRRAQAVLDLQRRLDANPDAASRRERDQLSLLHLRWDAVRTLRVNLRTQLRDLAERPFLDTPGHATPAQG